MDFKPAARVDTPFTSIPDVFVAVPIVCGNSLTQGTTTTMGSGGVGGVGGVGGTTTTRQTPAK